jgi:hypothetical protein
VAIEEVHDAGDDGRHDEAGDDGPKQKQPLFPVVGTASLAWEQIITLVFFFCHKGKNTIEALKSYPFVGFLSSPGARQISSDGLNCGAEAQKVARPHPSLIPPGEGAEEICHASFKLPLRW